MRSYKIYILSLISLHFKTFTTTIIITVRLQRNYARATRAQSTSAINGGAGISAGLELEEGNPPMIAPVQPPLFSCYAFSNIRVSSNTNIFQSFFSFSYNKEKFGLQVKSSARFVQLSCDSCPLRPRLRTMQQRRRFFLFFWKVAAEIFTAITPKIFIGAPAFYCSSITTTTAPRILYSLLQRYSTALRVGLTIRA